MFKIRKEHVEAFERVALANYEDRMVAHLKKFFSERCETMGELKVRDAIQYGIHRASGYGIVAERDVCLYIDIMFAFGHHFDKDPKFALSPNSLGLGKS